MEDDFFYIEDEAMENGYNIAMGYATVDELLDSNLEVVVFPFDPHNITNSNLKQLELYFASIDDFEKSIKLRDLQK